MVNFGFVEKKRTNNTIEIEIIIPLRFLTYNFSNLVPTQQQIIIYTNTPQFHYYINYVLKKYIDKGFKINNKYIKYSEIELVLEYYEESDLQIIPTEIQMKNVKNNINKYIESYFKLIFIFNFLSKKIFNKISKVSYKHLIGIKGKDKSYCNIKDIIKQDKDLINKLKLTFKNEYNTEDLLLTQNINEDAVVSVVYMCDFIGKIIKGWIQTIKQILSIIEEKPFIGLYYLINIEELPYCTDDYEQFIFPIIGNSLLDVLKKKLDNSTEKCNKIILYKIKENKKSERFDWNIVFK